MVSGTISGAAEILGRSQPAVSRMLDRLEHDLGISLFERRKGLVSPTEEAKLLLEAIERTYASIESLKDFGNKLRRGEDAEVKVAVMPAIGMTLFPQALVQFRKNFPSTKISLNLRMSATVEEWAAAQLIDFGVAEVPFRRSGFKIVSFNDAPYIAVVPASSRLANLDHLEPSDLQDVPFIAWAPFLPARYLFDQIMRDYRVEIKQIYETTFYSVAMRMVKLGLGVALVDPFTAVVERDDSVVLRQFHPAIPFNVALMRPDNRSLTQASKALLEATLAERDKILGALTH